MHVFLFVFLFYRGENEYNIIIQLNKIWQTKILQTQKGQRTMSSILNTAILKKKLERISIIIPMYSAVR